MSKRFHHSSHKTTTALEKLQQFVVFQDQPCIHGSCFCNICRNRDTQNVFRVRSSHQASSSKGDQILLKILTGLSLPHAPALKVYIPDVCFIQGQTMSVFQTSPKTLQFKKVAGIHPVRTLYQTMIKLRRQYKSMLGDNYRKKMQQSINPGTIHSKYLNRIAPTYLSEEEMREQRKRKEKTFIFHQNKKLVDENIEEHKIQEYQSFCLVKFSDQNSQIFTKSQFQKFLDIRKKRNQKLNDVLYFQSFIKEKYEQEAIFVTSYTINQKGMPCQETFDWKLFEEAQSQIMVLLGGLSKYSKSFKDIEDFEDYTVELMKNDYKSYVNYMTYKIIHYLGMVGKIYIKHIKINWVLNDINQIYLHSIFQVETVEIAIKPLRYRLPPKEKSSMFYKDSDHFTKLYMQIQFRNNLKRKKTRQILQAQEEQKKSFCAPKTIGVKPPSSSHKFRSHSTLYPTSKDYFSLHKNKSKK